MFVFVILIAIVVIIISAIFINFWAILLGIGILAMGGYLLEKDEKKGNKNGSKTTATIIVTGLVVLVFGIVSIFNDQTADSKDEEVKSSEVKKVSQEEKKKEETVALKAEEERIEKEKIEKKAVEEAKAKVEQAEKAKSEQEAKDKAEKEAKAKAAAEAKKKKESQTNATVTRVIDGDTIEVNYNGRSEDVRLLLIDTPETVHPSKPVEPFGKRASNFLKESLTGEKARIKVGSEERDKYGRLLAYVFIDGTTIQETLLKKGLARTAYLYNDLTMLDAFHKVQSAPKANGVGVWSIPGYAHADHNHGYHYQEEPEPEEEPQKEQNTGINTNVPDKDCGDFGSQQEAQDFMEASGSSDPHRLDGNDNDGLACESL